ncbi:MAG TPA: TonB family protein [Bryobacteraceae bacterium]|nr:TonB family protein [Bryobacteraceae bacterium]
MKDWEGQIVDNAFPLGRFLGGNAVFLTEYEGRPAAIKIVPADDARLTAWQAAGRLSDPHLIRLYRAGRCSIGGENRIYAVIELAEEDLSQVLPERALTSQETKDMLRPAMAALSYLHGQGLTHGRLRPSNIMAIGDQLKLSIDRVAKGDPADDVKGLGATLVEALTQRRPMWPHLPESLEQPFRDIAEHTLHPDSKKRWTLTQIAARLDGTAAVKRAPVRWQYLLPVGAAGLAILVFAWRSGGSRTEALPGPAPSVAAAAKPAPEPASARKVEPVPVAAQPEPPPEPPPKPKTKSKPEPAPETKPSAPVEKAEPETKSRIVADKAPGVEQEVLPEIPRKAVATVHGTMVVNVRVQVDPSGSVSDVRLEPPAASRYFAKYVLDAAKRWKFKSADHPQEWTLRFVITRKDMKVMPRKVS